MRLSAALFALLLLLPPIASSPLAPPPTSASTSTSTSISLPRPSCLSGNGSRVDWWFALKHPRGDNYSYLDSRVGGEAARQGLASATEGPLARTLLQLYAPPPSRGACSGTTSPLSRLAKKEKKNETKTHILSRSRTPRASSRWLPPAAAEGASSSPTPRLASRATRRREEATRACPCRSSASLSTSCACLWRVAGWRR